MKLSNIITTLACVVVVAGCSAKSSGPRNVEPTRSALGVFMKTKLNPPFSKLSFLLFHDEGTGEPADLPAAAASLVSAAEELVKWSDPPGDDEQGRLVFYEYAGTLKNDAARLLESVQANNVPVAQKAFMDLRKKCDSCHHFFRYEGTVQIERDIRLWLADAR